MYYTKILFVLTLSTSILPTVMADYDYDDSPEFPLDLLTFPLGGAYDYADSSQFSLDLYPVNRGWAESSTFSYDWLANCNPVFGPFQYAGEFPDNNFLKQLVNDQWSSQLTIPLPGETVIIINHGWNSWPEGMLDLAVQIASEIPDAFNVRASQRPDDSKLIDILYDLTDADGDLCSVWIVASHDGGVSWQVMPKTAYGAVWANVSPGSNRSITWDAGADVPGQAGNFKIRVFADDGNCFASMCFVPYDAESGYNVSDFWIGKYEVTNLQYCEYLNRGQPDSDSHWDGGMEITRSGTAGNYVYEVNAGRANYPMRYVSFYDAEAFCQWLSAESGLAYRLPNQNEWEMAAGWDPVLDRLWNYGFQQDTINCNWCNFEYCQGGPTPVGYYNGTNPSTYDACSYYGCYDMSGNIWEWTTQVASTTYRVLRGGDYGVSFASCQVRYYNYYFSRSTRTTHFGFRLILDLD